MAAKRFAACFLRLVLISLLVAYSFSLPLNWRSLNLIKKVNRKGPYIGLITVFPPEETAFFQIGAFKPNQKHPSVDLSGRRFLVGKIHDKKVVYVRCGVGMVSHATSLHFHQLVPCHGKGSPRAGTINVNSGCPILP
ncbi:unnamed protein product [Prunus armeniaca]|uniref:Uncharacterized protein n=1 Tax=Prunus armeniaca TaxID=36596 RepID=A0A6J5U2A2_PRUAR|nr:unnamed protein product [Prunus armeniaca]